MSVSYTHLDVYKRQAQKVYEKELSGGEANTTNNRMEMTALLEALRQLNEPCAIDLYLSLIHI